MIEVNDNTINKISAVTFNVKYIEYSNSRIYQIDVNNLLNLQILISHFQ